ncbi:hypothetical protein J2X76_005802 [Neorhizobium sp. 2083]|uniref:hypothetical protein n=1 Tax=Neorhizobium sp. 2083 TaxID=2817762 RepID=UPI00285BC9EF|nr:hypothetical protein [Neorhizobium sp. 2083]MDR6820602.1 hypothetical protein [Neorhizobium sp. 2083]
MLPNGSRAARRLVAASLACLLSGAALPQEIPPASPRNSAQIFFTGHSLIDNPLPDWVELIARSLGKSVAWEEQIVIGSPLRARTRGDDAESSGWAGYKNGKNRNGDGMDVIAELRHPTHVRTGRPYDTLVVAENHGSLGSIIWENAIGYLRHFHDRLLDGNPQGRTLYVHTWLDVDKDNPTLWLEHETNASTVWQCVAEKVRLTLQAENRPANLSVVPAGFALVQLVRKTLDGEVAGLSGNTRKKLDRIFRDNVHLTDIGIYFVAAVHYAAIYRQSPEGAAAPPTVPRDIAKELQSIAWAVTRDFLKRESSHPPDMAECRRVIVEKVCRSYWTLAAEPNEVGRCQGYFAETHPKAGDNPFVWPDPNWKALPRPSP